MSNGIPTIGAKPLPPLPREDLEHILTHTRELWEEVRGQNIFITGGTGFFGMWLLESFAYACDALNLKARAVVLTRDPARFKRKAPHLAQRSELDFIVGDIRTYDFPAGRFPFVIHGAAEASAKLNTEAPEEMFDVIVGGTRHVLEFAQRTGTQKLLLVSSGAVYGTQPSTITHIPEEYVGAPDPLLPGSAYGEGKRAAEHLCSVHASRFGYEAKIARCFAFVGPHLPLDAHFAAGNFIRDAIAGIPIRVRGDRGAWRSYLYAADLAIWLWTILIRGANNRAYNVGSDRGISIGSLAKTVQVMASDDPETQLPVEIEAPITNRYIPSVDRIRRELNLVQMLSLSESLRRTFAWHKLLHGNELSI